MQIAHLFDDARFVPEANFHKLKKSPFRLGDILLNQGDVDTNNLRKALDLKHQSGAPLGEILRENGWISEQVYVDSVARQWGLGVIDLERCPPEPELLLNVDVKACLALDCIPWRLLNGNAIIAIADPTKAEDARIACGMEGLDVAIAVASAVDIASTLETFFAEELEAEAQDSCPEQMSARLWNGERNATIGIVAMAGAAVLAVQNLSLFFWLVFGWILVSNILTAGFRIAAACARFWPENSRADHQEGVYRLSDRRKLPHVTLMIGLLKENLVLPSLLKHLSELDYPRERLQILFLLEEGDDLTENGLAEIEPDRAFDVTIVPKGTLETKPRALNYGLNFAKGEIVGILDAEDRPEPDQIRAVVEALYTAPPDVACVQGVLDFYNSRRNWFSRCFSIEYAIWFKVLLKGIQRLGLPIPLGGTTVYFRRKILEKIGGWDAHNVTEDADLGMRLYRHGYRTEVMANTTYEEANARVLPWIRQRSRWIKGYVMTWAVLMRRPRQLMADLGLPGFLAVQIIFLGGVTSYLSIPLLWSLWIGALGTDLQIEFGGPNTLWQIAFVSMLAGQLVMVAISISALLERENRHLIPWVFTLPLYWPIGAVAALKAIVELFFKPFYWDKTEHGQHSDQITLKETSPSGPMEAEYSPGRSTLNNGM